MIRKFLGIAAAWLIILVVFFAVMEIVFRITRPDDNPLAGIIQQHPGYLFEPNTSIHKVSSIPGEFDYTAHFNKYGYRGKDFEMPKPPGLVRIFAVGDSYTFGVGSEDDRTIPALLEAGLKAKGFPVEVINAGIGHTSPIYHEVDLRRIHLKYQPDIVVLFFDMTDLRDDWFWEHHAVVGADGQIDHFDPMFLDGKRDWWTTATYYSVFCRYINNKMVRTFQKIHVLGIRKYFGAVVQGKRAKALIANSPELKSYQNSIEYDGMLLMRGRERLDLIMQHWPRTVKYLDKIRELCSAHNIPLVIVMYPHGIYVGPDQWAKGRVTWGFEPGKVYTDYLPFELMHQYTLQNHIPFVNTLDDFLAAPKNVKYFFDWDGHMTTASNEIVARAVAESPVVAAMIREKTKNNK